VNGNFKVVLVIGFSVMFGFYASMIQGINNRIVQVGNQKSYYTEARMITTAGLNHAIYNMADPNTLNVLKSKGAVTVNNLPTSGDSVSYIIDNFLSSDLSARVTVTSKFGGVAAKQIAVIKMVPPPPTPPTWWDYYWNPYYTPYVKNSKPYVNIDGVLYCKWQVVKVYVYPYQLPA